MHQDIITAVTTAEAVTSNSNGGFLLVSAPDHRIMARLNQFTFGAA